jgi:hypothetical protein
VVPVVTRIMECPAPVPAARLSRALPMHWRLAARERAQFLVEPVSAARGIDDDDLTMFVAKAGAAGRELLCAVPGHESRALLDLLSVARVRRIVHRVASAFPNLAIPQQPGQRQLQAIDRSIRQDPRQQTPIGT